MSNTAKNEATTTIVLKCSIVASESKGRPVVLFKVESVSLKQDKQSSEKEKEKINYNNYDTIFGAQI